MYEDRGSKSLGELGHITECLIAAQSNRYSCYRFHDHDGLIRQPEKLPYSLSSRDVKSRGLASLLAECFQPGIL